MKLLFNTELFKLENDKYIILDMLNNFIDKKSNVRLIKSEDLSITQETFQVLETTGQNLLKKFTNYQIFNEPQVYQLLINELTNPKSRHRAFQFLNKYKQDRNIIKSISDLQMSISEQITHAINKSLEKEKSTSSSPYLTTALAATALVGTGIASGGTSLMIAGASGALAKGLNTLNLTNKKENDETIKAVKDLQVKLKGTLMSIQDIRYGLNMANKSIELISKGYNSFSKESIDLYNLYVKFASDTRYVDEQGAMVTYNPGEGHTVRTYLDKRRLEKDTLNKAIQNASGLNKLSKTFNTTFDNMIDINIKTYRDEQERLMAFKKAYDELHFKNKREDAELQRRLAEGIQTTQDLINLETNRENLKSEFEKLKHKNKMETLEKKHEYLKELNKLELQLIERESQLSKEKSEQEHKQRLIILETKGKQMTEKEKAEHIFLEREYTARHSHEILLEQTKDLTANNAKKYEYQYSQMALDDIEKRRQESIVFNQKGMDKEHVKANMRALYPFLQISWDAWHQFLLAYSIKPATKQETNVVITPEEQSEISKRLNIPIEKLKANAFQDSISLESVTYELRKIDVHGGTLVPRKIMLELYNSPFYEYDPNNVAVNELIESGMHLFLKNSVRNHPDTKAIFEKYFYYTTYIIQLEMSKNMLTQYIQLTTNRVNAELEEKMKNDDFDEIAKYGMYCNIGQAILIGIAVANPLGGLLGLMALSIAKTAPKMFMDAKKDEINQKSAAKTKTVESKRLYLSEITKIWLLEYYIGANTAMKQGEEGENIFKELMAGMVYKENLYVPTDLTSAAKFYTGIAEGMYEGAIKGGIEVTAQHEADANTKLRNKKATNRVHNATNAYEAERARKKGEKKEGEKKEGEKKEGEAVTSNGENVAKRVLGKGKTPQQGTKVNPTKKPELPKGRTGPSAGTRSQTRGGADPNVKTIGIPIIDYDYVHGTLDPTEQWMWDSTINDWIELEKIKLEDGTTKIMDYKGDYVNLQTLNISDFITKLKDSELESDQYLYKQITGVYTDAEIKKNIQIIDDNLKKIVIVPPPVKYILDKSTIISSYIASKIDTISNNIHNFSKKTTIVLNAIEGVLPTDESIINIQSALQNIGMGEYSEYLNPVKNGINKFKSGRKQLKNFQISELVPTNNIKGTMMRTTKKIKNFTGSITKWVGTGGNKKIKKINKSKKIKYYN